MPATLLIKRLDNPNPENPGTWMRGELVSVKEDTFQWASGELDLNVFYRFTVTDKTPAEMQSFLDRWNRIIDMNVVAGPDPQGFRRINVRNNLVNASGTMGEWTVSGTDEIILEWNSRYPTSNLTTVDIHQGTNPGDTWQCEGAFTAGQALEFEFVVVNAGEESLLKRTIWYITEAGMVNIGNAGGIQSGTAAQLSGILRDGLLD